MLVDCHTSLMCKWLRHLYGTCAGATEVYKAVKRASDSHLGVPSQCFNPQKGGISIPPRKPRDQYIGNVVSCCCLSSPLDVLFCC